MRTGRCEALLLISLLAVGCGGPPPGQGEELEGGAISSTISDATGEQSEALKKERPPEPAPEQAGPVDLKLVGSGFAALHDTPMHVAMAVMSCGYWVLGKGEAHVAQGAFSLSFPEEILLADYAYSLFFWSDENDDGLCDASAGDRLWQLDVSDTDSRNILVQESNLTPLTGWECVLFEDYGAP